jgi:hypothetical protein
VQFLAHVVGKVTEGEQVAGFVERNTLVETETLARQNFFGDGVKFRIFYAERAWEHSQIGILSGKKRDCNRQVAEQFRGHS